MQVCACVCILTCVHTYTLVCALTDVCTCVHTVCVDSHVHVCTCAVHMHINVCTHAHLHPSAPAPPLRARTSPPPPCQGRLCHSLAGHQDYIYPRHAGPGGGRGRVFVFVCYGDGSGTRGPQAFLNIGAGDSRQECPTPAALLAAQPPTRAPAAHVPAPGRELGPGGCWTSKTPRGHWGLTPPLTQSLHCLFHLLLVQQFPPITILPSHNLSAAGSSHCLPSRCPWVLVAFKLLI